jgi:hypothetical protein
MDRATLLTSRSANHRQPKLRHLCKASRGIGEERVKRGLCDRLVEHGQSIRTGGTEIKNRQNITQDVQAYEEKPRLARTTDETDVW